ncbi:hypothetical protein Pla52o_09660 [Novipirellula galeiformis]|uniref:Uncharacterized protein n=1 Tax=Novipirellula galeiformis TaxID=2528004 RepID=A0A5C6CVV7_9BACT|nr:hypothetical protein Pla52o_09660 [Novipirellula galeiformis]
MVRGRLQLSCFLTESEANRKWGEVRPMEWLAVV